MHDFVVSCFFTINYKLFKTHFMPMQHTAIQLPNHARHKVSASFDGGCLSNDDEDR